MLIKFINNLSLRWKFPLVISFLIIVPFSIAIIVFINSLDKVSKDIESKSLEETTHLIKQDLIKNLATKAEVYDLVMRQMILELESMKENILDNEFDEEYLKKFFYHHQYISNVYFVDSSYRITNFSSSGVFDKYKLSEQVVKSNNFLVQDKDGFTGRWVGPYQDFKGASRIVTYALPVHLGDKTVGVLAFDIDSSVFFQEIARIDPSQSSYVFIVRSDGKYIYSSDKIFGDFQLDKSSSDFASNYIKKQGIADILTALDKKEGIVDIKLDKNVKIIVYSTIPSFQAKLFLVSPVSEIVQIQEEKSKQLQQAVFSAGNLFLISLVVLALFIGGVSILFSQFAIINPLTLLKNTALRIGRGDMTVQIEVNSKDEIGILSQEFNKMVINLRENIKQLHTEKTKLFSSIESLTLGYIMIDTFGKISLMNKTAKYMLCIDDPHNNTLDQNCSLDHIEERLRGSLDIKLLIEKCMKDKKPYVVKEILFQAKYLQILATPVIEEHLMIGIVLLIEDITEAKNLERSKDEFFSIASHELRTPLTAIKGNSSLIEQFYGDKLNDPELKEMISDIYQSSERLIGIVNDFLEMGRLEQGKMVFKNQIIDIAQLIKSIVSEYQVACTEKKLSLNFKEPTSILPQVYADCDKLKQVLINLMGNAMKFVKEGGVTISTQQVDGFVKVIVADTGTGISVVNQNLLFRKFQQAGDSLLTRDTSKGTGLGLYISKLIINGMGGEIRLESSIEGKGSIFSFTVPIATETDIATDLQAKNTS